MNRELTFMLSVSIAASVAPVFVDKKEEIKPIYNYSSSYIEGSRSECAISTSVVVSNTSAGD